MHWLYRLQQHLAITAAEARTLLGLAALLMLGLAVQSVQRRAQPLPEGFYAETDSLFAQRSAGLPDTAAVRDTAAAGPLDLNRATAAELEKLPGIGPRLAERIVADRQANGPFRRIEELMRVRGIGEKMLAKVAPLLSVPEQERTP